MQVVYHLIGYNNLYFTYSKSLKSSDQQHAHVGILSNTQAKILVKIKMGLSSSFTSNHMIKMAMILVGYQYI